LNRKNKTKNNKQKQQTENNSQKKVFLIKFKK